MEIKDNTVFIKRTKKIVEQYDNLLKQGLNEKDFFDVTLLLNASIGLLVILKEKYNANIPKTSLSKLGDIWSIKESDIFVCKNHSLKDQAKTVKNIVTHLRNSIAHCHFKTIPSKGKIEKILFEDFTPRKKNKTFEATLSIEAYRNFLLAFTNEMLRKIKGTEK